MTSFDAILPSNWKSNRGVRVTVDDRSVTLTYGNGAPLDSVPRERVQAMSVRSPGLWRRLCFLHVPIVGVVQIDIAGRGRPFELLLTDRAQAETARRACAMVGAGHGVGTAGGSEPAPGNAADPFVGMEERLLWVDWRATEAEIVADCEALLRTGTLRAEAPAAGSGSDLLLVHGAKTLRVGLRGDPGDRYRTLCALNAVLQPDHELRFAVASNGSDTLAFLPLPGTEWRALEERLGAALGARYRRLDPARDPFAAPSG